MGTPSVDPWALTLDAGGAVILAACIQSLAAIIAGIIAICIAGGFRRQRAVAQARDRAVLHAEALKTIHDYLEAPYRVLRRDGSDEARMRITDLVSDIQARLRYYEALLRLQSTTAIADAYDLATAAARREAGRAMTEAWKSNPTKRDDQVPIEERIETPETDLLIAQLSTAIQRTKK